MGESFSLTAKRKEKKNGMGQTLLVVVRSFLLIMFSREKQTHGILISLYQET
jgi:hypothetical protein